MLKRARKTYGCPVEFSLDVLGGKWKPVILARLKEHPLRYGELRRLIPSLSDKVLTDNLRELEEHGFIGHDPAKPCYHLTPLGESLRPILNALYTWGETSAPSLGVQFDGEDAAD